MWVLNKIFTVSFFLLYRLLRKFKSYVRNKNRPEGSIAEGYIIEECMFFCSRYLNDMETRYNQLERNADGENNVSKGLSIFSPCGIPLGKAKSRYLSNEELIQAQEYVLKNCDEAEIYLRYKFSCSSNFYELSTLNN